MIIKDLVVYILGVMTGGGVVGYIMHKNHQKELDATYAQLSTIRDRVNGTIDEARNEEPNEPAIPYDGDAAKHYQTDPNFGDQQSNYPYPEEETDAGEEDEPDGEDDPEEDPDDDDLDTPLDSLDLDATKAMKARGDEARKAEWDLKKKIFNISDTDYYESEHEYDKLHITYHPADQTYTDEREEPVENIEELISSGLLFFGLHSGDKDVVYIRNRKIQADIEVCRVKE